MNQYFLYLKHLDVFLSLLLTLVCRNPDANPTRGSRDGWDKVKGNSKCHLTLLFGERLKITSVDSALVFIFPSL